ncbi:unnamed protein product [Mytilus edulis]|uniref:ISXO2-like transposase domain-containing protein n=1 Tax=Mytilus edulis TaxID=6550 RepID=A0A8S3R353_MYTED|nr:unnamed protein product [Mytilus edulis]
MSRDAGRQQHRVNVPAETPSQYWKRAMFIPFLDYLIQELARRLVSNEDRFSAQYLISTKPYINDLNVNNVAQIREEVERWIVRWDIAADPKASTRKLCQCQKSVYRKYSSTVQNDEVEIDESLFGRKVKYNIGKPSGTIIWIFGLIERASHKLVNYPVNNRSVNTLVPLIQKHVKLGYRIYSDSWAPYQTLNQIENFTFLSEHKVVVDGLYNEKDEIILSVNKLKFPLRKVVSDEEQADTAQNLCSKALSFTETFGLKPIKVDCKSESGLNVSFKLGENNEPKYSYEKIEAEDKEALKQILFLLDKFCISDAAFHELSMLVDDMPRKYMIVQCRDDINKIYHIERLPGNKPGAMINLNSEIERMLKYQISKIQLLINFKLIFW